MKTIFVYENWLSETPMLIGRLYVDSVRGGESYSFEYLSYISQNKERRKNGFTYT